MRSALYRPTTHQQRAICAISHMMRGRADGLPRGCCFKHRIHARPCLNVCLGLGQGVVRACVITAAPVLNITVVNKDLLSLSLLLQRVIINHVTGHCEIPIKHRLRAKTSGI